MDNKNLINELHDIINNIINLKNKYKSAYFESLFPSQMINFLKDINNDNLSLYINDTEYFLYLQYSQNIFLEKHLVQALSFKNNNSNLPDSEYLLYDLYNVFKQIKDYKTLKSLEKYKQIEDYKNQKDFIYIPRILRVASKFEFNIKQTLALEYIISTQSIVIPNHLLSKNFLTDYGTIGAKETLEFFEEKKLHVLQGFIELDNDYRTFFNTLLKSSLEILKSCIGGNLSQNQFLKIDNTIMSQVLREEPDFSIITTLDEDSITEENDDDSNSELSELESTQDIMKFIANQIQNTTPLSSLDSTNEQEDNDTDNSKDSLTPYTSDLEYLTDQFLLVSALMKKRFAELEESKEKKSHFMDTKKENAELRSEIREQTGIEKMMKAKCSRRLIMTKKHSKWYPRLEILSDHLKLTEFEKSVLIIVIGGIVSSEVRKVCKHDILSKFSEKKFEIGVLLWVLCPTLEEQMKARSYFYKSGTLVKEGIIHISSSLSWSRASGDLMSCVLEIDRRMLDFIAGIDSEINELVEGSNLYKSDVLLDDVILPQEQKDLILTTVNNYENFNLYKKRLGLSDVTHYGKGLVLLFYGPSGTGKTMMANALACHLQKRLLLINFGSLNDKTGDVLRFIFRESKINDAVLFFDECEAMFETRNKVISDQAAILTAIERHEGLIIMATNRAYDLDEAMYRRISLSVEFSSPDPGLREDIWKTHIPKELTLSKDVNLKELSISYELTGGFIKNAISVALSSAVARDATNPIITMNDLQSGAKLQLRGCMEMNDFDSKVIPVFTFNDLILPQRDINTLKTIVRADKAHKVLYQHWGFQKKKSNTQILALFHGPSGCGKTTAAEAIASELGKPLLVVNISALLSKKFQRGQSFQKVFKEAKDCGAILVFESCESLCDTHCSSLEYSTLFYNIEHFTGLIILMARKGDLLGKQFKNQFKYSIEFKIPSSEERMKLWRNSIPQQVPLSDDVNFKKLGEDYAMSGGNIKEAAFTACSTAALSNPDGNVTMRQFELAAEEELLFSKNMNSGPRSMFH